MKHNKYSIVGWFVRQALEDESITVFGDGKQMRDRSEEHTSELQSHSFISYAVFCLKKKNIKNQSH